MLVVEPTRKEGREGKKRKKERHKLIIIFLSEQIFLTTTLWSLHDNSFMTSLHVAICPWGTNYGLLAYPYVLSPPPPPIPLLHCLSSAGILFWLNGHKHKLSLSSSWWSPARQRRQPWSGSPSGARGPAPATRAEEAPWKSNVLLPQGAPAV